jgi:hypothetical protein
MNHLAARTTSRFAAAVLAAAAILTVAEPAGAQSLLEQYKGEESAATSPWRQYKPTYDTFQVKWLLQFLGILEVDDATRAQLSPDRARPSWQGERVVIDELTNCVHTSELGKIDASDGIATGEKCVVAYLDEVARRAYQLKARDGKLYLRFRARARRSGIPHAVAAKPYDVAAIQSAMFKTSCNRNNLFHMLAKAGAPDQNFGIQGLTVWSTHADRADIRLEKTARAEWMHPYNFVSPVGIPAIWVMDADDRFYVSSLYSPGQFNHSSFLAGAPVKSAGEVIIKNGKITHISSRSGHYRPPIDSLRAALRELEKWKVLADDVKVYAPMEGDRYRALSRAEWDLNQEIVVRDFRRIVLAIIFQSRARELADRTESTEPLAKLGDGVTQFMKASDAKAPSVDDEDRATCGGGGASSGDEGDDDDEVGESDSE